ncbi:GNAT family N-acetyltransferase [Vibrio cholerae]|uniref:GNAT family N-acetyltransferase n=4 Tax=Vibrio cholerae TaxID=666 RepID=A0A6B3LFM2_VIBCL|nr:GNAT family N-acetyltransferase [Vibrio cholerae]EGQ9966930.1 GNAT family N-acetyltransferase [Vibrio cholerae]EGR0380387.1 GNAT family N-acetyltransferase [Vibrio cholerae]EGR2107144.1 GNAT family N-acetyltransferase [Vibrio cholerae]EGR4303290.1 GNAT family N-acetyltransferase [Vibrio cholerae]EHQ2335997.1 GNAT family N-acetyltransferase [Vibrio cholerae]
MEQIEYRPLELSDVEISNIVTLLKKCFPKSAKFSNDYLKWLYVDNPNGRAIGFNAYINQELVGHYSCIPMLASVSGESQKGLLSLNTATHPNHQGKGLFRKLANETYKLAKDIDYKFVCGVANSRSSLLFVKLLKFQHVAPLEVKLSFGSVLDVENLKNVDDFAEFSTQWDSKTLEWRMSNPVNVCRVGLKNGSSARVFANTEYPFIVNDGIALLGNDSDADYASESLKDRFSIKMSLCLYPKEIIKRNTIHVNLPDKFKPSPLNFIYKDLTEIKRTLSPCKVFFNYLDFDAY